MTGRLSATTIPPGGRTTLEPPREGEDLFVYVTDGDGQAQNDGEGPPLGQYDVILVSPRAGATRLLSGSSRPLHYLSFYLPGFLEP